jgi:hypothetical protein
MIHQAGSGPSRDQLFHLSTIARDIPYRIVNGVAGCATPTGSAGHAGATADLKLTFHLGHSAGADHHAIKLLHRSLRYLF